MVIGAPALIQTIEKYNGKYIFTHLGILYLTKNGVKKPKKGLTAKITIDKNWAILQFQKLSLYRLL